MINPRPCPRPGQTLGSRRAIVALGQRNQRNLIETAAEFNFALIFASPEPQITARYCVPIGTHNGKNHISRLSWQILEPLGESGP